MQVVVIGYGSIGRRHAHNLRTLKASVAILEPDSGAQRRAKEEGFQLITWDSLQSRPSQLIVIATPATEHLSTASQLLSEGAALFIEKPLSHSVEAAQEFVQIAGERSMSVFVGCNMRFHPGPAAIKQALDSQAIGRVLSARLEVGSYMPDWRPGKDYRHSVSARVDLGGGTLLEHVHEIDMVHWFLGAPDKVFALQSPGKTLGIEAEELTEVLLQYTDGCIASVHQDFIQPYRQRRYELIGELGTLGWDARLNEAWHFDRVSGKKQTLWKNEAFDVNEMYMNQFKSILSALKTPQQDSLKAAVAALHTVACARVSIQTHALVPWEGSKESVCHP